MKRLLIPALLFLIGISYAEMPVLKNQKQIYKLFEPLVSIKAEKCSNENELEIHYEFKCTKFFRFIGFVEVFYTSEGKSFRIPVVSKIIKKKDHEVLKGSFKISKHFIQNWDLRLSLLQDYDKMRKENNGVIVSGSWTFMLSQFVDKKDLIIKSPPKNQKEEEGLDLTE